MTCLSFANQRLHSVIEWSLWLAKLRHVTSIRLEFLLQTLNSWSYHSLTLTKKFQLHCLPHCQNFAFLKIHVHYGDVIMDVIASQITSLTIVDSTVNSDAETSKLCVTGLCVGNSPGNGEFSAQMASNTENVSIWWRHHENWVYTN